METKQFSYLIASAAFFTLGIALGLSYPAQVLVHPSAETQPTKIVIVIGALCLGAFIYCFGNFLHELVKNRNK